MIPQLFCTFTERRNLDMIIDYIESYYEVAGKIYVFSDADDYSSLILSYNIYEKLRDGMPKSTILIHRKKETNTLYTINALNCVIQTVNNGVLDRSYKIDWELYQDSLLLVDNYSEDYSYRVVELIFEKIIRK